MHSCEVIRPCVRRLEALGNHRRGTLSMASQAAFRRPFYGRRYMCCWCPRVFKYARRGHVHIPLADGSGSADPWPMDRILGSPILPRIPGAVPYSVRAVVGHHPGYHGV